MKKVILLILSLCSCLVLWGQETLKLSGRVVDEKGAPLPYVQVWAKALTEGNASQGLVVEAGDGSFSLELPQGEYRLALSMLGYEMLEREVSLKAPLDLGELKMKEQPTELQTVVVQGRRVRVRTTSDGYEVDVQRLRESRNSALDLLTVMPNIFLRNGQLQVPGKKKILVKIGKVLQRVSTDRLPELLKGYDAKLVKRVEVVMQPPMRYDREGDAVLIVLHMDNIFDKYLGFSLGSDGMIPLTGKKNFRYGGYGSLFYNTERWFVSLNPYANNNGTDTEERIRYESPRFISERRAHLTDEMPYYGLRLTVQHQYSSMGNLGLYAELSGRKGDATEQLKERFFSPGRLEADSLVEGSRGTKESLPKFILSSYLEQGLSSGGRFWLDLSYFDYRSQRDLDYHSQLYRQEQLMLSPYMAYLDEDRLKTRGVSFKADFSLPLLPENKLVLEGGLESSWSNTENRPGAHFADWALLPGVVVQPRKPYSMLDKSLASVHDREHKFRHREWIASPYLSLSYTPLPQLRLRLGLRSPYTSIETREEQQPDSYKQNYWSLMPSAIVSYSLSRRHRLSLRLNTALERPKYEDLNSFEWVEAKNVVSQGNPELKPIMNYRLSLNYTLNDVFSIGFFSRWEQGSIEPILRVQGLQRITRPENARDNHFMGVNASYYYDKLSWMTTSLSLYGGSQRSRSKLAYLPREVRSYKWGGDLFSEFIFNQARTFTGYISLGYTGREKQAGKTIEPKVYGDLGLTYMLLERRLSLSLSTMNLIYSRYKGEGMTGDTRYTFDNRYEHPLLYFHVSYRFGKSEDKSAREAKSYEESSSRF